MKNSYFQTPRRSEDCTFHSWADPIHRDDLPPQRDPDVIVTAGSVIALIAIAAMFIVGWLK